MRVLNAIGGNIRQVSANFTIGQTLHAILRRPFYRRNIMPFFKYDSVFPYLHECPECEAQFVSIVPDISQVLKERRKIVRAKRPAQHTQHNIPLSCNGGGCHVASTCPSSVRRGSQRCAEHRAGA